MVWRFTKATPQEIADEELRQLLAIYRNAGDALWPGIERALRRAVDETTLSELISAYEAGNVARVESVINWQTLDAALADEMGPAMREAFRTGGELALRQVPGTLAGGFAVPDPYVERYLASTLPTLIREVTDKTREAVRDAVAAAYRQGLGSRAAARTIRESIGLTVRQSQAVARFRQGIIDAAERGDGIKPLTTRWTASRDVLHSDRQVTLANADRLATAYQRRLVTGRALNIARTEGVRAVAAGQSAFWDNAVRTGALDPAKDLQVWLTTPDERACPICLPMHGQQRQIGAQFTTGEGGAVLYPPAHPSCRCSVRIVVEGQTRQGRHQRRTATRIGTLRREAGVTAVP